MLLPCQDLQQIFNLLSWPQYPQQALSPTLDIVLAQGISNDTSLNAMTAIFRIRPQKQWFSPISRNAGPGGGDAYPGLKAGRGCLTVCCALHHVGFELGYGGLRKLKFWRCFGWSGEKSWHSGSLQIRNSHVRGGHQRRLATSRRRGIGSFAELH